jgi:preprotein translocase subunit SecD
LDKKNGWKTMNLIKNLRIIFWIFCIIFSLLLIFPLERNGVEVVLVSENLSEIIKSGDIIYEVNGEKANINNIYGFVHIKTNRGEFDVNISKEDIVVEPRSLTNLKFGLDIKGGILAIVKPEKNVSDETLELIKNNLERRMSSLRESSFQIVKYGNERFIQIQIAGGTEDEVKRLINTTGVFEAKIPIPVKFENGEGIVKFGDEDEWFKVKISDKKDSITYEGKEFKVNESFIHKGIEFTVFDIKNDSALIAPTVYKNSGERIDVVRVYTDPQHSYIQNVGNYYEWKFDVEVSQSASENFYKAVKNLGIRYEAGRSYLESKIYLYLDGKLVSNLSISSTLKNRPTTMASVSGSAPTKDEAIKEKNWLQLILRSGALPTNLQIVSTKVISPKLGASFLRDVFISLIAAIICVSIIIFLRYRSLRISIPALATSFSEVIILLGLSVLINWNLDLASIAGIIVIVGTGVDQQIMIIDETLSKTEILSLKLKLKRAFFMIFTSAGTTICAMLPLMTVGFGMLKGFAITTTLGILVAIFITRPAFSDILERLFK